MRLSRVLTGIMATAIALGALGATPARVEAAGDQFQDMVTSTYEVQPSRGVVHVTHVIKMANKKASTSKRYACTGYAYDPWYGWYAYSTTCTTRTSYYYFASRYYAEKDAKNLKVKTSSGKASLRSKKLSGDWRLWEIKFSPLNYGKTRTVTFSYDLPAGGPRSTAERRVGWVYSKFCASGSSGDKGRVRVVVPEGYSFAKPAGMSVKTSGGKTVYDSGLLKAKPWEFYRCFSGMNPKGYVSTTSSIPGGPEITVAAWKGDTAWAEATGTAVEQDLPKMAALLGTDGLPSAVRISEELSRTTGGNPYDPKSGAILMSEDVTERAAALHAVAAMWFPKEVYGNGWLQSGYIRWAEQAAGIAGVACGDPGPPPITSIAPLPSWVEPEPGATGAAAEAWAWRLQASCWIVDLLADAIGEDRMLEAIALAKDGGDPWAAGTLSPTGSAGKLSWQAWLDLVTERGLVPAGADLGLLDEALVRFKISADPELLAQRQVALKAYHELLADRGSVPAFITDQMRTWDFAAATVALATMKSAFDTVATVETVLPDVEVSGGPVEVAVTGAESQGDLDAAVTLAETQVTLAENVAAAFATEAAPRDPLQDLGLAGTEPADHAPALDAVEAVDASVANGQADQIRATIAGAKDTGTQRAALAGGGILGVLMLAVLGVFLVRRRSSRAAPEPPGPAAPAEPPPPPTA